MKKEEKLAIRANATAALIEQTIRKAFAPGYTIAKGYKGKKLQHRRTVSLVLSDAHFQSILDPQEVPVAYGTRQESRRLGKIIEQTVEYKHQHRAESTLSIKLLGDMIQGQLHDPRDGAPVAQQFAAALHYLVQAVLYCAKEYPRVKVICATGNHGRNVARHVDRAVSQKWDSLETMLYYSLDQAIKAAKAKNVRVFFDKRPYAIEELHGKKALWTHGDTVLKPGYPGRTINMTHLYHQITKWNAARKVGGPFHLFGVGHVHIGSATHMPGGVVMLTNGCLVPPDPFAVSIGAPDVTCGQYIFESIDGYIFGDSRFITVDDADRISKYNDIIPEFRGF